MLKKYPIFWSIAAAVVLTVVILKCNHNKEKNQIVVSSDSVTTIWQSRFQDCDLNKKLDSIQILVLKNRGDYLQIKVDSLISANRNLKDSLFFRRAQISNCKKYVRICINNPSQDQFLKGWLIRALDLR